MSLSNLINNGKWNDIIKKINNKKIKIDDEVNNGNYLIHYAGLSNNLKVLRNILKNGGYIDMRNKMGENIAHISAKLGYNDMLKFIIKKDPYIINKTTKNGESVLHILYNNNDMLTYIFNEYGKYINTINKVDKNGNNILIKNIKLLKNDTLNNKDKKKINDIIKLLIKNGVNINCPKKYPPIIAAIDADSFDIVKILVKNGVDINAKDNTYVNAFILSVVEKKRDIAKYLLDNGRICYNISLTIIFQIIYTHNY